MKPQLKWDLALALGMFQSAIILELETQTEVLRFHL